MPSTPDYNFMPAVKCPHCGKTNRPAISGWGSTFNTRTKYCKYCEKEYTLVVYVESSTERDICRDVNYYKGRIDYYRKRTYELVNKLTNKAAEYAEEFLRVESGSRGRQN